MPEEWKGLALRKRIVIRKRQFLCCSILYFVDKSEIPFAQKKARVEKKRRVSKSFCKFIELNEKKEKHALNNAHHEFYKYG